MTVSAGIAIGLNFIRYRTEIATVHEWRTNATSTVSAVVRGWPLWNVVYLDIVELDGAQARIENLIGHVGFNLSWVFWRRSLVLGLQALLCVSLVLSAVVVSEVLARRRFKA